MDGEADLCRGYPHRLCRSGTNDQHVGDQNRQQSEEELTSDRRRTKERKTQLPFLIIYRTSSFSHWLYFSYATNIVGG